MQRNPALGFALLLLAVCAGGVGFGIFGAEYVWVESTQGRVADIIWVKRSKTMCSPVFAYTVDGQSYRAARNVQESSCSWSEGEELTIYYRAHSPGQGYALTFFGLLPLIIGGVTTVGLLLACFRAFRGRPITLKERLAMVAITTLAEAPAGDVVGIRGRIEALSEPDAAPMTGRACLAWQLRVTRWIHTSTVPLRNDYSLKQFKLDDGEHVAVAAPGEAVRVFLEADERGRTTHDPSAKLEAFLRSKGFSSDKADTANFDYEWKEGVLQSGDEAVVYAVIESQEGAYQLRAPEGGAIAVATEDLSTHT